MLEDKRRGLGFFWCEGRWRSVQGQWMKRSIWVEVTLSNIAHDKVGIARIEAYLRLALGNRIPGEDLEELQDYYKFLRIYENLSFEEMADRVMEESEFMHCRNRIGRE